MHFDSKLLPRPRVHRRSSKASRSQEAHDNNDEIANELDALSEPQSFDKYAGQQTTGVTGLSGPEMTFENMNIRQVKIGETSPDKIDDRDGSQRRAPSSARSSQDQEYSFQAKTVVQQGVLYLVDVVFAIIERFFAVLPGGTADRTRQSYFESSETDSQFFDDARANLPGTAEENQSASTFMSMPRHDDLQQNGSRLLLKIMLLPIKIPYKLTKFACMIPFNFLSEVVDALIEAVLVKLRLTKGEAKTYAKKFAWKQLARVRALLIVSIIAMVVFGGSLALSTSMYTAFYFYMMPNLSQHMPVHFK